LGPALFVAAYALLKLRVLGGLPRPVFSSVFRGAGGFFAFLTLVPFFAALPAISCLRHALGFEILKALVRLGVDGLQAVNAVEPPEYGIDISI
jgi:hypothetical protein